MLTLKTIYDNPQRVIDGLRKRNFDAEGMINEVLSLDEKRRNTQTQLDNTLAEVNSTSKLIGALIKEGKKEEEEEKLEQLFFRDDYKQAMQLCVYAYAVLNEKKYPDNFVECGIWSFAEANKGVQNLQIYGEDEITDQSLLSPMNWVKNVIVEILNPASDFVEEVKQSW